MSNFKTQLLKVGRNSGDVKCYVHKKLFRLIIRTGGYCLPNIIIHEHDIKSRQVVEFLNVTGLDVHPLKENHKFYVVDSSQMTVLEYAKLIEDYFNLFY